MIEIIKGLVRRNEKYLMLKRAPFKKYFPDYWDFPGGKLEEGEDPKACVERKIVEETNQSAKAIDVAGVYELDIDGAGEPTHRFTIFTTESFFGDVRISAEHREYRWMTRDEIMALDKVEPYIITYFEEHPTS